MFQYPVDHYPLCPENQDTKRQKLFHPDSAYDDSVRVNSANIDPTQPNYFILQQNNLTQFQPMNTQPYQNLPNFPQNQSYQNQPAFYPNQLYQNQLYQNQRAFYPNQLYQNYPTFYPNQPCPNQPYPNQPYPNQPYQNQPYQNQQIMQTSLYHIIHQQQKHKDIYNKSSNQHHNQDLSFQHPNSKISNNFITEKDIEDALNLCNSDLESTSKKSVSESTQKSEDSIDSKEGIKENGVTVSELVKEDLKNNKCETMKLLEIYNSNSKDGDEKKERNKRKQYSVEFKMNVILMYDDLSINRVPNHQKIIAEQFEINQSTVCRWLRNRENIIKDFVYYHGLRKQFGLQ